jgi:carbon storage regulator CsrA
MLILSRKVDEKIHFPTLGITILVQRIGSDSVRLGIDAPPHVPVLRDDAKASTPNHLSKGRRRR